MSECYDGHSCCDDPSCSGCGHLEGEAPAWVLEARAAADAQAKTCSLYEIADGKCGQSDLNCDYVKYAKAAEKGLSDGTCADNGYSVETGTQTKHYPVIGDIVITTYSKAIQAEAAVTGECYCSCCNWCHMSECYDGHSCCDDPSCSGCGHLEGEAPAWVLEARAAADAQAKTCSLYEIADGKCGQSDLNCDYVKYAKAAEKGLSDGTCADNGYSVETGTQTKHYPVIGDIVITTYSKGLSA